jgi:hypothetical protein
MGMIVSMMTQISCLHAVLQTYSIGLLILHLCMVEAAIIVIPIIIQCKNSIKSHDGVTVL